MEEMIPGIICLEIGILTDGWLRLVRQQDPRYDLQIDKIIYSYIIIYCMIVGRWIEKTLSYWMWYGQLACGILAAYLLAAAIQDIQRREVYDLLHLLALPPGLLMLGNADAGQIISLIVFMILQFILFMHLYGKADGYAFIVCAVYECCHGRGMLTYLLHMASVFLALAVVQCVKRNISRSGNLRKEVPLIPYITATVWLFL